MREVLFLIGRSNEVLWQDVSDSPLALPDSRARWQAIWRLRDELSEIAHSHPVGPLAFSAEDEATMAAITQALGRSLRFSVVTNDAMIVRESGREFVEPNEPPWVSPLRSASGLGAERSR